MKDKIEKLRDHWLNEYNSMQGIIVDAQKDGRYDLALIYQQKSKQLHACMVKLTEVLNSVKDS